MRRFRKKNRADIADDRPRIPAFAGMTKCYWRIIVFCRGEPFGAPTFMVRAILTNTRHSRESGNPEATVRYTGPVFLAETLQEIPAFAGMTSVCKAVRFFHTLFRGNDEE